MKKLLDFFSNHKYSIIWTAGYVCCMYLILWYMFKFNMFSLTHWHHLMHAELRGFPGFVFGILILSALPIYIATTALIVRTKKPLLTIPVPGFIKTIWSHMQPTLINPPATEQSEEKKSDDKNSDSDELPPELPSELRTAYIRARLNISPEQRSAFNQPCNTPGPENIITATETETPDEIPLPSDFDIDIEPEAENYIDTDFSQMKAPTFSDINFDSVPTAPDTTNELTQYLDNKSIEYKIEDDLIITDKHTIASHTDSDFWICDDDNWFATGKQCPSPIPKLLKIASENKTKPIMYLGATNIMDLDTIRQKWESMGITVITSPDEIN